MMSCYLNIKEESAIIPSYFSEVKTTTNTGREITLEFFVKGKVLTSIYSLSELHEGEYIPKLVIPAVLKNEEQVIPIEIIGPSVFGNTDAEEDYSICNEAHPVDELIIQNGIQFIVYEAFMNTCVNSVIWPDTCQRLSTRCFENSSVEYIKNLWNVTLVGADVFARCKNLSSVNFGNVVVCDENAFRFSKVTNNLNRKPYIEKITVLG